MTLLFQKNIYFLLHLMVGEWLLRNGRSISKTTKERFKIITNSFGGASDIIMSDSSDYFGLKMKNTGKILTHTTTVNQVIAQVPGKIFLALKKIKKQQLICFVKYEKTPRQRRIFLEIEYNKQFSKQLHG